MGYDLLAVSFTTPNAKTIVAHQLAHDPSISLQKAMALVERPPVVVFRNLTKDELKQYIRQFSRVGVELRVVRSGAPALPQEAASPLPPTARRDGESNVIIGTISRAAPGHAVPPIRPFVAAPAAPRPGGRRRRLVSGVAAGVAILTVFGLLALMNKENRFVLKKSGPLVASGGRSGKTVKKQSPAGGRREQKGRADVTDQQRLSSRGYVDSARSLVSDLDAAIRFYKIAISFNRYNVNAWYGLVNAYREAGMTKEMKEAQSEMDELFGDRAFSLAGVLEPYGELREFWRDDDGSWRIEYATRSDGREELTREALMVSRAIVASCSYREFSLFARTGPGKGLIAHVNEATDLGSIGQFERSVTALE